MNSALHGFRKFAYSRQAIEDMKKTLLIAATILIVSQLQAQTKQQNQQNVQQNRTAQSRLTETSALDWPVAPSYIYPEIGEKRHQLDYIFVDISDWEKYCAGDKYETNVEIPAKVTYYTKDNELVFSQTCGIRLSGIFIRKLPQKSIAVEFSGKRFGSEKTFYDMFPTRDYDRIRGFVIRAHGNPMGLTFFKDGMMNESLDEWTDLEYSAYRPIVIYVNGQYHGLYNLREKKNKDFLRNLYSLPKGDIEVFDVNGGEPDGEQPDYREILQYVRDNDMSKSVHYKWVSDRLEIDNFIDYNIAHSFYCNTDWPKANVKVWRPKGGKYRFLFFDCDRGFIKGNVNFNTIDHISGIDQWQLRRNDDKYDERLAKSSILMTKLCDNKEFTQKFAIRYQDLLNTCFTSDRLVDYIDMCRARIESEVPDHITYWKDIKNEATYQFTETVEQWERHIADCHEFVQKRPAWERRFLSKKWNLGDEIKIPFMNPDTTAGYAKINTVVIKDEFMRGIYFSNLDVKLQAIPNRGYEFDHWEGYESSDTIIVVSPDKLTKGIKPHFRPIEK